jgi:uncharacterized glyoxalase superfamily protein PhnB
MLYKNAFNAEVSTINENPIIGKENQIIHAEIVIHNLKLLMNDFGNSQGVTKPDGQ